MIIKPFNTLMCPLDGAPLVRNDHAWVCPSGHSFDIAKQGYTHLLSVQNKRSLDPGDHKEMVAARRRFLNAGYYQSIASAVNEIILARCLENPLNTSPLNISPFNILDAGCGEGYYLRALSGVEQECVLNIIGVDISKWAVLSAAKQAAAKQDARMNWVVASNANLPIEENSLDCVLCMFGFPVYKEFSRVLKAGGYLLQVDAGSEHLKEMREIIYANQKEKLEQEKEPKGFCIIDKSNVRSTINLNTAEAISDLLAMTPHLYRASAEGLAKVRTLTTFNLTIDVNISVYKKIE